MPSTSAALNAKFGIALAYFSQELGQPDDIFGMVRYGGRPFEKGLKLLQLCLLGGPQRQRVLDHHVTPIDFADFPAQFGGIDHLQTAIVNQKGAVEGSKLLAQRFHRLLLFFFIH